MQKFDLAAFEPGSCAMTIEELDVATVVVPKEGGGIAVTGRAGHAGGVDWTQAKYLVFDVVSLEDWTLGVTLRFWKAGDDGDSPSISAVMGVLPGIKTRLCLPLECLSAQQIFLPRTPGRLKTVVFGSKLEQQEVARLAIGAMPCSAPQTFEISNLQLACEEPHYPVAQIKLVDELGQLITKDWKGKTDGVAELKEYLQQQYQSVGEASFPEGWSTYGGSMRRQFEATGFFRTEHDGERWWLVDPDGCPFFSTGLDCVQPAESSRVDGVRPFYMWLPEVDGEYADAWGGNRADGEYFSFTVANSIRAFGDSWLDRWSALTKARMVHWGFNTIGNWSSQDFIQRSRLPYVLPLHGFPDTEDTIFRDFPDVYSDGYAKRCQEFAQQLESFCGDPYMIGYFLRNEPHWAFTNGLNIAEELLATSTDFASKDALIMFLAQRYQGDIGRLNEAWNTDLSGFEQLKCPMKEASKQSVQANQDLREFSRCMIERYVALPSQACKACDPHHMNLGMRYAWVSSEDVLAGCEHFDVFSINCYQMDPSAEVERVGSLVDRPILIGEFHFGALDRGLLTNSLRGVTTQEERGKAYRYYVEHAASNRYCVGTHYFTLLDQGLLGRFDGENFQIGCVDVCHRPYQEFVDGVQKTNRGIYDLLQGKSEIYAVRAQETARNGF